MHTVLNLFSFMMAGPPAANGQPAGNPLMSMLPLILMFVVLYFLMIRPQQKKAKELKKMLEEVRKGDKVVTAGGICGVIANVKDGNIVTIKIAENVRVDFVKSAITQVEKGKEVAEV